MNSAIIEDEDMKIITSEGCNHYFNKHTGKALTWGRTREEDPDWCPMGPLIADIEVSTICHGVEQANGIKAPCGHCYKGLSPSGKNMSFETFKIIMDKLPKTVTQVAFGADSELTSNPDLWKIMAYCRYIGVIPNVTTANVSDEVTHKLSKLCGAVAISRYFNKDICYNSVKKLTDLGMTQCNIHQLVSVETFDACLETIDDIKSDPRLSKLNAVVFLTLKQKNRGKNYHTVTDEDYTKLVAKCLANEINFGFDSCSANRFLRVADKLGVRKKYEQYAEPCESSKFSMYANVDGDFFPCSFMDGENNKEVGDWRMGLSIPHCEDFIKDIWQNKKTARFRTKCIKCINKGENCPYYKI